MFFVGIKTLTNNLRELTGRRFRQFLERSTRYPIASAAEGALLGATMQTGSAITFILVGTSASSVSEIEWIQSAIISVNGTPIAAFMLAGLLSIAIQSPQSVAILAIAMTTSGILDTWTTMVIIYGSNFGGGLSTYLLSAGFKGTSRQIMVFQVLFNVITGLVLLGPLFQNLTAIISGIIISSKVRESGFSNISVSRISTCERTSDLSWIMMA